MPDKARPKAERRLQQSFSKSELFAGLLVAGLVIGARMLEGYLPDRIPQADALAAIDYTPVRLSGEAQGVGIAGAWRIDSKERRIGALSALAIDGPMLVAINDSGVVIRLSRPGTARPIAALHDLPDGPGDPRRKSRRDSEAVLRLANGDWLVAFENRHVVWRYDSAFRRGRQTISFGSERWPTNRGIEAMTVGRDGTLVAIPEGRGTLVTVRGAIAEQPLASDGWTVSDATRLADGRPILLLRRITAFGFRNGIGELVRDGAGWRVILRATLPLGPLDNGEGLAAEPLAGGGTRLWIVTDNDFAGYRRTLLLAVDLTARRTN